MPASTWNNPITRYEMAMIMSRISSNILKEKDIATAGISRIMEDYNKVQQNSYYTQYVEQSYIRGLMTGKNANGLFDGGTNGTRAEAATMVARMLDTTRRVKVDVNKVQVPPTTVGQQTLRATDPSRPEAKAGDIFIKPDGTKVVLKVGPSGVLGQNQGVATDLGRSNGISTVKDGFQPTNNSYGIHAGDKYRVNPYTGEGHWAMDWIKIFNTTRPTTKGTSEGQLSADKNWEWSYNISRGAWFFVVDTGK